MRKTGMRVFELLTFINKPNLGVELVQNDNTLSKGSFKQLGLSVKQLNLTVTDYYVSFDSVRIYVK